MAFEPTHRVGEAIPTWPTPDRSQPPGPELYAGLEVQLLEQQGELSKVLCDNGWEAWVDSAALAPLVVAPSGPPPPPAAAPPPAPAPAAAAAPPPPPPDDGTPATPPAPRPAWLVPAAIVGAVVLVIALVAALTGGGGNDHKTKDAGAHRGETVVTAEPPKAVDAARVFPTPATFATADGGNWEIAGFVCRGTGTGPLTESDGCADDIDKFNFLCNDEHLGGTKAEAVAEEKLLDSKRFLSATMQSRVYDTTAHAQSALEEVGGYYKGPCQNYGDTVYTPVAVAEANQPLGDDYVAYVELDTSSQEPQHTDHVWVRTGRVLVSFAIERGTRSVPEHFYRDLAQSVAANARAMQANT
jgi:hypothetical protein